MLTTQTMKAATVIEYSKPLQILEVAKPVPKPGRILVKITASSLCMSDIMGHCGITPSTLPYCGGHEPVGVIERLGEGVQGFRVGDRVGFMLASDTCQNCEECLSGQHRFCNKRVDVGFHGPYGGWSEFCIADPLSTVKIPDGLTDEEAAPLICAGVTAYAAVRKAADVQQGGLLINIIGSGGVGHMAIMYAKAMGFQVTAFDITEDKLKLALDSGADKVINSLTLKDEDIVKSRSTIVISGARAAYDMAFKTTLRHGRVVAVGVPHMPITVDILHIVLQEITLVPVCMGSKYDLYCAFKLAAEAKIKPVYERKKMVEINEGFEDMKAGKVIGRYVYSW